jgi:hypothetical protein
MEDENEKYAKELEVAVRIVHVACALCGKVQDKLLATEVVSKEDDSPVTVAGIYFYFHNFNPNISLLLLLFIIEIGKISETEICSL